VRVHVERDVDGARVLRPWDGGAPWAVVHPGNVLAGDWGGFAGGSRGSPVIAWSGTPADSLFESDPRAFGPLAWERFGHVCDRIAAGHGRVIFRPHARHVLCDVQRVAKFQADRPVLGVALDAASLMEPSMVPKVVDHFRRAFETLGPLADVIWLSGVDEAGRAVPLGEGVLAAEMIVRLWREHCSMETPVVLIGDRVDGQVALLKV
jgi:hypothetical protein